MVVGRGAHHHHWSCATFFFFGGDGGAQIAGGPPGVPECALFIFWPDVNVSQWKSQNERYYSYVALLGVGFCSVVYLWHQTKTTMTTPITDSDKQQQSSTLLNTFHKDGYILLPSPLLSPSFISQLHTECLNIFHTVLDWLCVVDATARFGE